MQTNKMSKPRSAPLKTGADAQGISTYEDYGELRKLKVTVMHIREVVITVGILSALFGCGKKDSRFVSESKLHQIVSTQTAANRETLAVLRKHGVTDQSERKLEYFFYTDAEKKASDLAAALKVKGYSVEYRPAADGSGLFVVKGWTTELLMSDSTVVDWCVAMCQLGFEHDCEFDGWGTYTEESDKPK